MNSCYLYFLAFVKFSEFKTHLVHFILIVIRKKGNIYLLELSSLDNKFFKLNDTVSLSNDIRHWNTFFISLCCLPSSEESFIDLTGKIWTSSGKSENSMFFIAKYNGQHSGNKCSVVYKINLFLDPFLLIVFNQV